MQIIYDWRIRLAFCFLAAGALSVDFARGLEPAPGVHSRPGRPLVDNTTRINIGFDRLESNRFANAAGSNYPGEACGDVVLVPGCDGQAIRTGINGYVGVSLTALGDEVAVITLECRVCRGADASGATLLEAVDPAGTSLWNLVMLPDARGSQLKWTVDQPATGPPVSLTSNRGLVESNRWYRVALVYGSVPGGGGTKALQIYLDDYLAAEAPWFGTLKAGAKANLRARSPAGGGLDDLVVSVNARGILPEFDASPLPAANLDFEAKSAGWGGVYDDCHIEDKVKHGGQYSLRIETPVVCTREYLSPMFGVETGTAYRVSFWAKVDRFDEGYSALGVWVRWYFEPEETCSFGGDLIAHCLTNAPARTFDWKLFSGVVSVPQDPGYRAPIRWARIQVKNYHSRVLAWIDDIRIEKLSPKELKSWTDQNSKAAQEEQK